MDRQYSPRFGEAARALDEVIVTIERCPVGGAMAIIRRATAWVRKNVPRVFTAMQRSKLSGVTSRRSPRASTETPALLTRQDSGPSRAYDRSSSACVQGEIGDVGGEALGRDAAGPAVGDGAGERLRLGEIDRRDVEAGGGERQRGGAADAALRAGHQARGALSRHPSTPWASSSRAMIVRWIWLVPS